MYLLKNLLNEQSFSGKTLVSVDIQPEYQSSMGFKVYQFADFLNKISVEVQQIIFLYNGSDTLGMISEQDYKYWLYENDVSEELLDSATFYDKGYAFFRYCMDSNVDEDVIANFIRFMYENQIRDSRDVDREFWAKYLRQYRRTDKRDLYDLLKMKDECVNIPDLMDFMKRYNNIVMVGGGVNECLKEVEIALKALNKPYNIYSKFTF